VVATREDQDVKISSPIISAGSGSLAGLTASRNKGGLYLRARAVPTNPSTVYQQAVRNAMSTLVDRWTTVLTPTQRGQWDVYAMNTPVFNTLGASINLTGQQQYLRSNVPRLITGLPAVDDGPGIFNLGSFTVPTFTTLVASTSVLTVAFDNTDEWANETGASLIMFVSRPQNPSVNYFKGPYRQWRSTDGNDSTPPTSPVAVAEPFTYAVGSRCFIKANVTRADGRYSQALRITGLAT
jgi:hypothetical protein